MKYYTKEIYYPVCLIFDVEEAAAELERIEREKEELECKNREVTLVTFSLNFQRMILISCPSSLLIKLFTYSDFIKKKLVYCAFVRFYLCPTFFHISFSLFDFQSIIDSTSNWIFPYYIYLTH